MFLAGDSSLAAVIRSIVPSQKRMVLDVTFVQQGFLANEQPCQRSSLLKFEDVRALVAENEAFFALMSINPWLATISGDENEMPLLHLKVEILTSLFLIG